MTIVKTSPGEATQQDVDVSIFLPHEIFAYLWVHERNDFEKKFFGGPDSTDALPKFWSELEKRKDPRLDDHPMISRRGWRQSAIPIAWHGDGLACIGAGKPGAKAFDINSWGVFSVEARL